MRKLFLLLALTLSAGMWANELEDAKAAAVEEIKQVAATAKEEIDGLGVDESDKSDAKAQIDNIAYTAKAAINEATNKDMINKAKHKRLPKSMMR